METKQVSNLETNHPGKIFYSIFIDIIARWDVVFSYWNHAISIYKWYVSGTRKFSNLTVTLMFEQPSKK
jgi:hypothetical protein